MKLFLDTEFNGWGGDLISMALVPAMGEPFYCVLDVSAMPVVPWVRDNVLPVLFTGAYAEDAVAVKTSTFQSRLAAFLRRAEFRGGVEIIADWPDDIKYFCAALVTGPEALPRGCLRSSLRIPTTLLPTPRRLDAHTSGLRLYAVASES